MGVRSRDGGNFSARKNRDSRKTSLSLLAILSSVPICTFWSRDNSHFVFQSRLESQNVFYSRHIEGVPNCLGACIGMIGLFPTTLHFVALQEVPHPSRCKNRAFEKKLREIYCAPTTFCLPIHGGGVLALFDLGDSYRKRLRYRWQKGGGAFLRKMGFGLDSRTEVVSRFVARCALKP